MSMDIADFLRIHNATPVGLTPSLPAAELTDDEEGDDAKPSDRTDLTVEINDPEAWVNFSLENAQTARKGEFPTRFIDGCHAGQPVLCLTHRELGWPIPLYLAEIGAISLQSSGRTFTRQFHHVERVLSFVANPFPWEQVEAFSYDMLNNANLSIRVLCAATPDATRYNMFDYDAMKEQARNRAQFEMAVLERLAFHDGPPMPTLIDGPLQRVGAGSDENEPLTVGVIKRHSKFYLHDRGLRLLNLLKSYERTPCFVREETKGGNTGGNVPVLTWYLRLAGGANLAPNWGYVRVEVPYSMFKKRFQQHDKDFTFVDRLSRWLIDARCRSSSYARSPVSLEPIVRAEDTLKPLFTPLPVLVNRLYRQAGLFRGNER